MRLLLDTHVLIETIDPKTDKHKNWRTMLSELGGTVFVSVASLWEIAIKVRLGKLPLAEPVVDLPDTVLLGGFAILPIVDRHAIHELECTPETKDPFDRLLLGSGLIEATRR